MGVRTVFIDVDLTLVDAHSNLRAGVVEALQEMKDYGYSLYAWSHGGYTRADQVIKQYKLEHYFRAWMGKPDMIIDDSPPEELVSTRRVNYLNSGKPGFWGGIWNEIFHKDVHFAEDKTKNDPGAGPGDSEPWMGGEAWEQLELWDRDYESQRTTATEAAQTYFDRGCVSSRCGCDRGLRGAVGPEDGVADRRPDVDLSGVPSRTDPTQKMDSGSTRRPRR